MAAMVLPMVSQAESRTTGSAEHDARPNILFIMADDLGYSDLSCYGQERWKTPQLDELASQGILFTSFYSASPVSSPSRAAFLTGRYPARLGIQGVFFPDSYTGIPSDEITIAELLKTAGYATGIVGKWHLGHMHQYLPLQNGFDSYFGIPYSNDMASQIFMRNNEVESFHIDQRMTVQRYTSEAIDFIDKNSDSPFFLFLSYNMMHVPIYVSPEFDGVTGKGLYADAMTELDWSVGRLIETLESKNLLDNTIVIFTSDNGPWLQEGPYGGTAETLKEGKGTDYEGGVRVPCIVYGKNIAEGKVYDDVATMMDWFPTFADLAGVRVPDNSVIDGCNLADVLNGKGKRVNSEYAYFAKNNKVTAYRSGRWKILLPDNGYRGNFWKEPVAPRDTMLIDLVSDSDESDNLWKKEKVVAKEMLEKLDSFANCFGKIPAPMVQSGNNQMKKLNADRKDIIEQAKKTGYRTAQRNYIKENAFYHKADSVLGLMKLQEKIGQMVQFSSPLNVTGPEMISSDKLQLISQGKVGSMLNVYGVENVRKYQEAAMKSRLRIPLIFGLDVVHGFRTAFPIPLAEASSFDLEAIRQSAAAAAAEATAAGLNWTFAPMVDISYDARWGRVMEGAGEDPYYGAQVAKARISGFQGQDLSDTSTLMACCKHFAAYGAPEAGKDYNSVNINSGEFANFYMPPYKASAEAGAATFMTAFSDFNNIPSTANEFLLQTLLRDTWKFSGFVVSDWGSVAELVAHRVAEDRCDAARKAAVAGVDMDMEGGCYSDFLEELVEDGIVSERAVDDAVIRILIKKFELGLFEDPFRYCDEAREARITGSEKVRQLALDMAKKSVVMLKNDGNILPKQLEDVLLVGPLSKSKKDMSGFWANESDTTMNVTLYEALKKRNIDVEYFDGYGLRDNSQKNLRKVLNAAKGKDAAIVVLGERWNESGEAKSKGLIELPESQQRIVSELSRTGVPVIAIIMGGRPLIFNEVSREADAILFSWWLGAEAGNALCDLIDGTAEPSARLPMTFPKSIAQIPIRYNFKSTGRPHDPRNSYSCGYIDMDSEPAYPFGFGLGYTSFEYGDIELLPGNGRDIHAVAVVNVTNTGYRSGSEIVQLYIRDKAASVTRPVKELKGFRKITLNPGETAEVSFEIGDEQLGFYDNDFNFIVEKGGFEIYIGGSSDIDEHTDFILE